MENKWISVKDRLPEDDQYCLVVCSELTRNYKAVIARYYLDEDGFYREDGDGSVKEPTHWMPLPDPPK